MVRIGSVALVVLVVVTWYVALFAFQHYTRPVTEEVLHHHVEFSVLRFGEDALWGELCGQVVRIVAFIQ